MLTTKGRMTIGEVARRTGASIRTLRSYDRLGILCVQGRSESNHRLFTDEVIACVRGIREFQTPGLTLRQIQRLVAVERKGGDSQAALADAYEEARARLDRQIERLKAKRRNLIARAAPTSGLTLQHSGGCRLAAS